jgi:uncharacterized coiled-coil protein SlyX
MHIQRGGDAMMADEMSPRRLERIGVDHDILERAKALENIIHSSEGYETVEVILGELISEVERLRSYIEGIETTFEKESQAKDARIKELEASRSTWKITAEMALIGQAQIVQDDLRGEIMAKDFAIDELRKIIKEQRKQIERLEAAFLEAMAAKLYYERSSQRAYGTSTWESYPEDPCHCKPKDEFRKKSREALEKIRSG